MKNLTIRIPDDLKSAMDREDQVNWSAAIRVAIRKKLRDDARLEVLAKQSKLTQKDADTIGALIKQGVARRHRL